MSNGSRRSAAQRARHQRLFESVELDAMPQTLRGGLYTSLEFVRTPQTTAGKYLMARVVVPPGHGPIPHLHHATDEWFYAPDGGLVALLGHRTFRNFDEPPGRAAKDRLTLVAMEPHDLLYGPRQQIHGYVNAADREVVVFVVWREGWDVSIQGYFEEIAKRPADAPIFNTPCPTVHAMRGVAHARKYGMNFSTGTWEYADEIDEDPDFGQSGVDELEALFRAGGRIHAQTPVTGGA